MKFHRMFVEVSFVLSLMNVIEKEGMSMNLQIKSSIAFGYKNFFRQKNNNLCENM